MDQELWETVLGEIEPQVPHATFVTWYKLAKFVDYRDGLVELAVHNVFAKRQFEVKLNPLIISTLKKHAVEVTRINYIISDKIKPKSKSNRSVAPVIEAIRPEKARPDHVSTATSGLNKKYDFQNFIVGSSNDLAYTASQAVASNPGVKYNPLFLYGGVGLGKTHLIQAIGNEVAKNNPKMKLLYVSTETFVSEFLDSIRYKIKGFSEKYRNVDVLMVDDMQFIAGKEKTQEEFFHTFNSLHQANKQIIISSDRPPKNIPTLTERLRSRFESGMAIDIQMPDFETRCAIISTKAAQSGIEIEQETVEFLAENIKTNIRELEGALNQLLAYCEMRGAAPDVQTASGLLGDIKSSRPRHISPRQIIERTARHFEIPISDICSARRDKHIVLPRQVAMYLLRSELRMSFPRIATELGRKDHTTALHSVDKIERAIKLDYMVREQVATIRDTLYV